MRLAIDAMGNDNGPYPILEGVRKYLARDKKSQIILVGHEDKIRPLLVETRLVDNDRVIIRHAPQVIEMEDKLSALREKRDSSIAKVVELVKTGEADAMVALGNTMAAVATTRMGLKHLEGVHRAGIAVPMPSVCGVCIVNDMGANINSKPKHLYTYGVMASSYSHYVLGVDNPRVGLLNVGEEEVKGSDILKDAFSLLKNAPINFIGNVEGGDIFNGKCDVVVCDGFVGNAVLKASEAVASTMGIILRNAIKSSWLSMLGAALAKPAFKQLKQAANYDQYGGAPLLGVNGVCIIGHGRSNSTAVMNALRVAHESVAHRLNEHIHEALCQTNFALNDN
ncbi:MAG: phosphate acyltransferase PlsX [Planctomycetes bacterium]|nr:phosphate acyltransferase PlsX [Planctomycetota bacterium]